ncbi:MAG: TonB family protein [Bdellovibrionales bacterium]|nr:TonB family protein [Bdellovibrionales bacterium]
MKKYIFWSLLLHIGIGTALISWSGISVSEWTQNLLNNFGIEQNIDETADLPEEILEEEPRKLPVKKIEKKKPLVVQKPKAQAIPVVKKKIEPKVEDASTKQTDSNPQENETVENSSTEDLTEETAQTEPQEIPQDTKPEVQYNPQEDLTAIKQADSAPSENLPAINTQENVSESISNNETETDSEEENTSESVSNRDFEEINTDPQELKKIIKESPPQKEVKSSQTLVPAPGNPQWAYPQQARDNKNEGSVFLQYFVDETGFVDKIQLLKSSGYSILDNEALRVMARQRYEPGQAGWYRHKVDFKLKNM